MQIGIVIFVLYVIVSFVLRWCGLQCCRWRWSQPPPRGRCLRGDLRDLSPKDSRFLLSPRSPSSTQTDRTSGVIDSQQVTSIRFACMLLF
ncbi:hypothetical protein FOCC_FOCC009347, partial [Frankliniella occidentalis]